MYPYQFSRLVGPILVVGAGITTTTAAIASISIGTTPLSKIDHGVLVGDFFPANQLCCKEGAIIFVVRRPG